MNDEVKFGIEGCNMFDCELLLDASVALLDVVDPEVDVADWESLGEVETLCGEDKGDLEASQVGLLS